MVLHRTGSASKKWYHQVFAVSLCTDRAGLKKCPPEAREKAGLNSPCACPVRGLCEILRKFQKPFFFMEVKFERCI